MLNIERVVAVSNALSTPSSRIIVVFNYIEAGHSIECITHASHSIAFLHFVTDPVTLTFDLLTPKIISLVGSFPVPSWQVKHFGIIRFFQFTRADRHTDRHTDT